jgi:hypothetical protein
MKEAPESAHEIAVALAHLGKIDKVYEWLEKAADEGALQGLWYDLFWDYKDKRFRKIAAKVDFNPQP